MREKENEREREREKKRMRENERERLSDEGKEVERIFCVHFILKFFDPFKRFQNFFFPFS